MRKQLIDRVVKLETQLTTTEPRYMWFFGILPDGGTRYVNAWTCSQTGTRTERRPGESDDELKGRLFFLVLAP